MPQILPEIQPVRMRHFPFLLTGSVNKKHYPFPLMILPVIASVSPPTVLTISLAVHTGPPPQPDTALQGMRADQNESSGNSIKMQ